MRNKSVRVTYLNPLFSFNIQCKNFHSFTQVDLIFFLVFFKFCYAKIMSLHFTFQTVLNLTPALPSQPIYTYLTCPRL